MGDPDARARLAELMDQRRRDLRLTWDQVAARADIHRETLRQIRSGSSGTIRPLSATGIEDALEWGRGSIDAILHGGSFAEASPPMAEQEPPLPENLAALVGSVDNPASPESLAQALAETTANLDAYIERRAQEIAAPRIAAVEQETREQIANLNKQAIAARQRASGLEAELRRQLDAQVRRAERAEARVNGQ
jgi:hypothetical protein